MYREDEGAIEMLGSGKMRRLDVVDCREMELRHYSCAAWPRRYSMSILGSVDNAMSETNENSKKGQGGGLGTSELLDKMQGDGITRGDSKCPNVCTTEQVAMLIAHVPGNEY